MLPNTKPVIIEPNITGIIATAIFGLNTKSGASGPGLVFIFVSDFIVFTY
jgi:hypothetical protein